MRAKCSSMKSGSCCAGDYNVIPDARDVYDPAAWVGDALYCPADARKNFANCWRSASPTPCARPPTRRSIIRSGIIRREPGTKNNGLRIDHLLLSPQAADRLQSVAIDKDMRAKDKPSDHVPIRIDLRD